MNALLLLKNSVMFKVLQNHVVLFTLILIGRCSQAMCATCGWGALTAQDIADITMERTRYVKTASSFVAAVQIECLMLMFAFP
jgi:hypothetical protein